MSLSEKGRRLAESLFERRLTEELRPRYWDDLKLVRLRHRSSDLPPSGVYAQAIARIEAEFAGNAGRAKAEAIVEAHEKTGVPFDDAAFAETLKAVKDLLEHHSRCAARSILSEMGQSAPEGFSKAMEGSLNAEIARRHDAILAYLKVVRDEAAVKDEEQRSAMVGATRADSEFSFVQHDGLREVLKRDYRELQRLDAEAATKSMLVLAGGIIEGLLLDALVACGKWGWDEGCGKNLDDMIGPALKAEVITEDRLTNAVKRYRALIHPGRELRQSVVFGPEDANLARSAVDVTIREVRKWFEGRGTNAGTASA